MHSKGLVCLAIIILTFKNYAKELVNNSKYKNKMVIECKINWYNYRYIKGEKNLYPSSNL